MRHPLKVCLFLLILFVLLILLILLIVVLLLIILLLVVLLIILLVHKSSPFAMIRIKFICFRFNEKFAPYP